MGILKGWRKPVKSIGPAFGQAVLAGRRLEGIYEKRALRCEDPGEASAGRQPQNINVALHHFSVIYFETAASAKP